MTWFKTFILSFFVSTLATSTIPFYSCGSGTMILRQVSVDPFPIQKSVNSTLTIQASLNKDLTNGDYTITLNLGGLQIYSNSGDVCSLEKDFCPQKAGEKTFIQHFSVPSLAPSGSYTAKAILHSGNELVACYTFGLDLLSKNDDYASCVTRCPTGGSSGYARQVCLENCYEKYISGSGI